MDLGSSLGFRFKVQGSRFKLQGRVRDSRVRDSRVRGECGRAEFKPR